MRSDRDPSLEPVPDDPRDDLSGVPLYATAEEVAYAAELAALDRADDAALRAEWEAAGFDVPVDDAAWDAALAELADDDALIGALRGPAHAADLMLVESIDPRSLTSKHAQVDYLRACDRIAAKVGGVAGLPHHGPRWLGTRWGLRRNRRSRGREVLARAGRRRLASA